MLILLSLQNFAFLIHWLSPLHRELNFRSKTRTILENLLSCTVLGPSIKWRWYRFHKVTRPPQWCCWWQVIKVLSNKSVTIFIPSFMKIRLASSLKYAIDCSYCSRFYRLWWQHHWDECSHIIYTQILVTLNLWDTTSKFLIIAMFVIVDLWHYFNILYKYLYSVFIRFIFFFWFLWFIRYRCKIKM